LRVTFAFGRPRLVAVGAGVCGGRWDGRLGPVQTPGNRWGRGGRSKSVSSRRFRTATQGFALDLALALALGLAISLQKPPFRPFATLSCWSGKGLSQSPLLQNLAFSHIPGLFACHAPVEGHGGEAY